MKKRGAPQGNQNRKGTGKGKTATLSLRLRKDDKEMIKRKASKRGLNQSDYVVDRVRADDERA